MTKKLCLDLKRNDAGLWECWHKIPITWAVRKTMKQKKWPLSLGVNRAGCTKENCEFYVEAR